MEDDKLLHTIRLQGNLSSGGHLQWSEDCVVALSALSGVHLFESSPYSNSLDEPFVIRRDVITPPDEVQERDYDIDKEEMLKTATRDDLHILKLNRFPSHGYYYNNSFKGFQDAVWSAKGVGPNQTCCLAVLTCDHWLALYCWRSKCWQRTAVLSDLFYEHLKKDNFNKVLEFEENNSRSEHVKNYLNKGYATSTVKIIWSHAIKFNESQEVDFSCLFAAQKNGLIVIWKITPCKQFPNEVAVWNIFDADVGAISSFHWIKLNKNSGFLIVGGVSGQCHAYQILFNNSNDVVIKPKFVLWSDKEMLSVASIGSYKVLDTTYIVCAKGPYLIAWKLENVKISKLCHYSSEYIQCVTGLAETDDGILSSTADGILFKIRLNSDKNEIICDRICINLEDKHQTYNGICSSPNKVLACGIKSITSSYDHLLLKEALILTFFTCSTEEDIVSKCSKLLEANKSFVYFRDLLFYWYYNYKKSLVHSPYVLSMIQNEKIVLQKESSLILQLLRWLYYFIRFVDPENEESVSVILPKSNIIERLLIQRKMLTYLKSVSVDHNESRLYIRMANIVKWCKKYEDDFTTSEMSTINNIAEILRDSIAENNEEPCPICKSNIPLENLKHGKCLNGHVLGRCFISLVIFQKNEQMKCTQCSLYANADALTVIDDYSCPFCHEVMS